jgi:hypothetical protein
MMRYVHGKSGCCKLAACGTQSQFTNSACSGITGTRAAYTFVIVKRSMKPASRTMGDRGEGRVARTRRRRAVEVKGWGEWSTLHMGGGARGEDVVFSEGVGVSSRVGGGGKPWAGAGAGANGRDMMQMSRGSRLRTLVKRQNPFLGVQNAALTCWKYRLHCR